MRTRLSRRDLAALSAACLVLKPSFARGTADEPARLTGAVAFDLGGTHERMPWRITLYIPPGAVPADGWPVLYLLDGNAVTATAIDIERVQAPYPDATGIGTRFVVVGIGYPGDAPYDGSRRSWDYTPPPGRSYAPSKRGGPAIRTGGADEFLRFVLDDLRPAIARRCTVDPSRQAVFGHSFGGLFVLYALSRAPTAFSHWIAASPSIYWEDAVVLGSIADLERAAPKGAHVLLLAGAYEEALAPFQRDAPDREARRTGLATTRTPELTREMTERLSRIPGVTSTFSLIPGRTHMTVLPEALNAAVAFFLQRPR